MQLGNALSQHLPPIVLCLVIVFLVSNQTGGRWITVGMGFLLSHELFSLFVQLGGVYSVLETLGSAVVIALVYTSLILGFGFVSMGVTQPLHSTRKTGFQMAQLLKPLLLLSIAVEVSILLYQLIMFGNNAVINQVQDASHSLTLALLIAICCYRYTRDLRFSRETDHGQRQLDAMVSMFSAVKHELTNDIQVIVGNAELADIQIDIGGDLRKPVNNISNAAKVATERIEQLIAFNSSDRPVLLDMDLNATLRVSMAKLVTQLPSIVTLRLDLAYLPVRVMADRNLLSLSLINLINQAVKNMQYGGEIFITTKAMTNSNHRPNALAVTLEVFIVRARGQRAGDTAISASNQKVDIADTRKKLENEFASIETLMELSGAVSVAHSLSANKHIFTMGFATVSAAESGISELRHANEYSGS